MTRLAAGVILLACLLPLACTEESVNVTDPGTAPGSSSPTLEVELTAGDLPAWRDTTFAGFSLPASAPFRLVSDRPELTARILGRVVTLPDSLSIGETRVAVESFEAASLRLTLDTARSLLPPGGLDAVVMELTRSFDAFEATWLEARSGEPWAAPGGDVGARIGGAVFTALADTVVLPFDVDADSLLTAWRANGGEPGFAVLGTGPPGELLIRTVALVADARPEGRDTIITVVRSVSPSTFIHEPASPATGGPLRLGGLPAARAYISFDLPATVQGFPLRGSTINRAVLELRPLPAPSAPFALGAEVSGLGFRLLTDPFVDREKTPIGSALGLFVPVNPDSLAAGRPLQVDITTLLALWSVAPADSIPALRVGVRSSPEGSELGMWEFGSVESPAGLQPVLRMLVTPRTVFRLP